MTEHERIRALPGRAPLVDWTVSLRLSVDSPPLLPAQNVALTEFASPNAAGLLAMLGVGHGKTLLSLLLPKVWDCKRPVICTHQTLVAQHEGAMDFWARYYDICRAPIITYQQLSNAKTATILEELRPDVLILDEGAAVRSMRSARARRVVRYVASNPDTRVAVLSGSLTGKSILDIYEIAELALRDGSPFPTDTQIAEKWAAVLDPRGKPDHDAIAAVAPLVTGARPRPPAYPTQEECRAAVRKRLNDCAGVVLTWEASVDVPLKIVLAEPSPTKALREAYVRTDTTWELPMDGTLEDGSAIVDAIGHARALRQLSLGFFYKWEWPNGRDEEWLEARNKWASEVRAALTYRAREGYDSELLVRQAAERGQGANTLLRALKAWKEVEDRPRPKVIPQWVDGMQFLGEVLNTYVSDGTIIWYSSKAVEAALQSFGIPVHGAGSSAPSEGTAAAHISVHGTGKHLAQYSHALVLEPPVNGPLWEQLLGRLHRNGQERNVTYTSLAHTQRFKSDFAKAREEARYAMQMTGSKQKLLDARIERG